MFEQAIQQWGVNLNELKIALSLNTSEMVKAVVESGVGAAAIPEVMVQKEQELKTLWAVQVVCGKRKDSVLEIVQPIWKLKHRRRFQTRIAIAFEEMLLPQAVAS